MVLISYLVLSILYHYIEALVAIEEGGCTAAQPSDHYWCRLQMEIHYPIIYVSEWFYLFIHLFLEFGQELGGTQLQQP